MGAFLAEWLGAIWFVLLSSGPYLLLGFTIAGLLKVFVPERWIVSQIGGDDTRSVAFASMLGLPLPMCSCSVIPMATQLRRSGASKGATTSFLISAPEIGVESVGVTWALMDPLMTILRPIGAFFTAFVSGTLVNGLVRRGEARGGEGALEAKPDAGAACGHDHTHAHDLDHAHDHAHEVIDPAQDQRQGSKLRRALRYAFGTLLDDLAPWLVLGFLFAGLIVVLVPDDFFRDGSLLSGWPAMFMMLVVGLPMYICASATTPVAAALMAKGLDPGAALVLLLAGPAANVATMLIVKELLGRQVLVAYLVSISACSLALGALANALYPFLGLDPTAMRVGDAEATYGPFAMLAAALVLVLVLRSAVRQRVDRRYLRAVASFTRPLGLDPNATAVRCSAALVLLAAYLSTALSVVRPGETGFLVRYGEVVATLEGPGHRWHAPWPFTRLETVPVGELRQVSYGLRQDSNNATDLGGDDFDAVSLVKARVEHERRAAEAEVLTRDEYLLAIGYSVRYRVVDAHAWRFVHEDPDSLVGALAEGALRSAASRLAWREVLNDTGGTLQREVHTHLAERVRDLGLGCEIVAVDVQSAHAPALVHTAFRDVASASEERVAALNRARQSVAIKLATAHGDALSIVRTAEAEALRKTTGAAGEAGAVMALGQVWAARPTATAETLAFEQLRRTIAGRTLLLVLGNIVIDTYDRSGAATTPSPPLNIFEGPPSSDNQTPGTTRNDR